MDPYTILQCSPTDSMDVIKRAYRKLQLQYHPDKTDNSPSNREITQQLNSAYEAILKRSTSTPDPDPRRQQLVVTTPHTPDPISYTPTATTTTVPTPEPLIKTIQISICDIFEDHCMPIEIQRHIQLHHTVYTETETIYITIPQGIDTQEIILLEHKGHVIDTVRGDVKLFIQVINNTEFIREGLDLLYKKTITLREALCGFSFCLTHPNRKTYNITNTTDNIVQPGHKKIFPKLGIPRNGLHGKLIVVFTVQFPTHLSESVKDQIRALLTN